MAQSRILLGVTGGIAAYKSAELVRLLTRAGHQVRVVMTRGAEAFVTPMTFQALSGNPVRTSLLDPEAEAGMGHIELARWADLVLVAPASADFMARLAAGMADDLLTTVCCATDAPICVAPAMNQAMWRNHRTQRVVNLLREDPQIRLWGPDEGAQACGDVGPGRMLEPEALAAEVAGALAAVVPALQPGVGGGSLEGVRVVITAGPTREPLDPVRYITNHSSGKMGYALAEAARDAGARVTLVSGPVTLSAPAGVTLISVVTAEDMLEASVAAVGAGADIFVGTAAVADYRPEHCAAQKIKKTGEGMTLSLVKNPDTLATIAALPEPPFTVGFAAETTDLEHYARDKMRRKKLAMIVANDVSAPGIGFNSDQNAVTVFWPDGNKTLGPLPKNRLATQLVSLIAECRDAAAKKAGR